MLRRLIDATGVSFAFKSTTSQTTRKAAGSSGVEALEPRMLLSSVMDWTQHRVDAGSGAAVVASVSPDDDSGSGDIGILAPMIDQVNLTATLNESKLPAATIAGVSKKLSMPVTVTNTGDAAAASGTRIAITIVARPADAADDSQDVVLTTLSNKSISGLKAGKSKTFKASFTLPAELPENSYTLVAIVDSDDVVEESDESDNQIQSQAIIAVASPFVNLTGSVKDTKVPSAVIAGTSTKVSMPVTVKNEGNVSVAKGTKIAITIVARPADAVDDSQDVVLTTLLNKSISSLKAGKSKTFKASFTLPAELAQDSYQLVAIIDSSENVTESDETDNAIASQAVIQVASPFVNLALSINDAKLPASQYAGQSPRVTLPVIIHNQGNVAIASGTTTAINIYARPEGADDDSQDLLVASVDNVKIGGLKAGKGKGIKIAFNLPGVQDLGGYTLLAQVDSEHQVEESDEEDNVTLGSSIINVTLAPRDLTVTADGSKLPASAVAGAKTRLSLPVTVTNIGTQAIPLGQVVQIVIRAVADDAEPITVCVFNEAIVSRLRAGASKAFNLKFTLPDDQLWVEGVAYHFEVEVDSCYILAESDEENNTFITEQSVLITKPGVNLSGSVDEENLPSHAVSGSGESILLPVTVTNTGTNRLQRNQTIDIHIVARTSDNPETDIVVGELLNQNVSLLAVGASRTFNAYATLPLSLESSSDVRLVVVIDSSDQIDEINEDDNFIHTGTLEVTQGIQDLALSFTDESGLDEQVIEGASSNEVAFGLTLTNAGTALITQGILTSVTLHARPVGADDDSSDVLITTLTSLDISNLAMGESLVLDVSDLDLSTIEPGQYHLVASVSDDTLLGSSEDNNQAISEATFEIVAVSLDLSVEFDETAGDPLSSIIEGSADGPALDILITNQGNVTTWPETGVSVTVVARPVDILDDSQDVVILTQSALEVSGIAPGQSKSFQLDAADYSSLAPGQYQLIVTIIDEHLPQAGEENNTAFHSQTLEVIQAITDVSLEIETVTLPDDYTQSSSETGSISLIVTNRGNIVLPADSHVGLYVYARLADAIDDSDDILLASDATINLEGLAIEGSQTVDFDDLDLSALARGQYVLVAVLQNVDLPNDEADNNVAISAEVLDVQAYGADLAISVSNVNLVDFEQGGGWENRLHVILTNVGELPVETDTFVTVSLYARLVGQSDGEIHVGEFEINVSSLAVDDYVDTLLNDLALGDLAEGTYNLLLRVDDSSLSGAEDHNNELVTVETFTVLGTDVGI